MEPDLNLLHPQPVVDDEEDRRKRPIHKLVAEDVDDPMTPSLGDDDEEGFAVATEPLDTGQPDGG